MLQCLLLYPCIETSVKLYHLHLGTRVVYSNEPVSCHYTGEVTTISIDPAATFRNTSTAGKFAATGSPERDSSRRSRHP